MMKRLGMLQAAALTSLGMGPLLVVNVRDDRDLMREGLFNDPDALGDDFSRYPTERGVRRAVCSDFMPATLAWMLADMADDVLHIDTPKPLSKRAKRRARGKRSPSPTNPLNPEMG